MSIELESVSKRFGSVWAIRDITLSVGFEQLVLVSGDNGSGKSSLLRLVAGLSSPDKGEILFSDTGLSPRKSRGRLSYAGVESMLYDELSVVENLELYGHKSEEIDRYLSNFSLEQFRAQRVSSLSSGIKKRLSLVRAMMIDAQLYLLDEPLNFLDSRGIEALFLECNIKLSQGSGLVLASNRREEFSDFDYHSVVLKAGGLCRESVH